MPEFPTTLFARLASLPARALLGLVWVYQRAVSPVLPAVFGPSCGCRFYPTCSHYAAEALRTHGALAGTWLALKRLAKCTPRHPGGIDLVPLCDRPRRLESSRPMACTRISRPSVSTQSLFHG
jgi:putative membrane protein insertion efficiency factor